VKIDARERRVYVGPREALLTAGLALGEQNWLGHGEISDAAEANTPVLARVRSTREPLPARLVMEDDEVLIRFDDAEEGVAPGQACVLYDAAVPSRVLGGGFITRTVSAYAAETA